MLEQAGLVFEVQPAPFDDSDLVSDSVGVVGLAMALAYFKAAAVSTDLPGQAVIGADTLCIDLQDQPVGKPAGPEAARSMIKSHQGRTHRVVSGVAILCESSRRIFADVASITFGELGDDEIDRYIESGEWQGKAGGYNLTERLAAGWPIDCHGDPDTVVGLPLGKTVAVLAELGIHAGEPA